MNTHSTCGPAHWARCQEELIGKKRWQKDPAKGRSPRNRAREMATISLEVQSFICEQFEGLIGYDLFIDQYTYAALFTRDKLER